MATIAQALSRFRQVSAEMDAATAALRRAIEAELGTAGDLGAIPADLALIQRIVAEHYGFQPIMLVARRRDNSVATARQVALALCREFTRHGNERIGAAFCRHNSNVPFAVRAIANRAETEPDFRAELERLRAEVRTALSSVLRPLASVLRP